MRSGFCPIQGVLCLIASGLTATALAQTAPHIAPIPRDPRELATGQIESANAPAKREAALQLLSRARNSYQLRNLRQPWDLKIQFSVDSHGQTNYDGAWEMEDTFSPGQGLRWTAKSSAGYAIAGIFGTNATYADAAGGVIPLRLQEARAMLYNPLPSVAYAGAGSIRTAAAAFGGSSVICLLLAPSNNGANQVGPRAWEESEDCIDSQSGLLQMHSEAPGRYAIYDYTNAPRLENRLLPRTVTITEGGRAVSTISVQSLEAISSVDPSLFVPTDAMKAAGPAVAMTAATKISRLQAPDQLSPGMTLRPVCVLGMVTPTGRLIEAHSLQPSDPNSDRAVKDAEAIDFSPSMRAGAPPQQHFVFVLEKFASAK